MATMYSGWVATDDWRIRVDFSVSNINGCQSSVNVTGWFESQYGWSGQAGTLTITVNGSSWSQTIPAWSGAGLHGGASHSFPVYKGQTPRDIGISASGNVPSSSVAVYRAGTSCSSSVGIPQCEHHSVTFNGNGGTVNGAATQTGTKWYGTIYYIPTFTMARENYVFLGWARTADATTPTDQPGGAYGADQNVTFYAVWKRNYILPLIWDLLAERADSTGAVSNEGTYAALSFKWKVDKTITPENQFVSATCAWREHNPEDDFGAEVTLTSSTTSSTDDSTTGLSSGLIGDNAFDAAKSYEIRITVTDSNGSSTQTVVLPQSSFTLDFSAGGHGIGLLGPAPSSGVAIESEPVEDWIVSQDFAASTNGSWLIRKWHSGVMELFGKLGGTGTSSGDTHWLDEYPVRFVTGPGKGIYPTASGGMTAMVPSHVAYCESSDHNIDVWVRGGAQGRGSFVNVHVIGWYK